MIIVLYWLRGDWVNMNHFFTGVIFVTPIANKWTKLRVLVDRTYVYLCIKGKPLNVISSDTMANIQNRFILPPQLFMRLIWNDVQTKVSQCAGVLQIEEYISTHHILHEWRTLKEYHSEKTWGGIMNRLSNWLFHIIRSGNKFKKNLYRFY